jgi:hypothetical protein
MSEEKQIRQDVDGWQTCVVDPALVDLHETHQEKAQFITASARIHAEALLRQLDKDGIVTDYPGEFYVVVGYRSRPKSY